MRSLFISASIIAIMVPAIASAQSGKPAAGNAPAQDILVTGSRVVRNGYQAPTPVTVVGVEQLQRTGVTRLVDFSRTLPQFRNQGGRKAAATAAPMAVRASSTCAALAPTAT